MRATAVLTVRNEGAFLLEWVAHHLGIGFTDLVILSNDCDDGTDRMLDRLAEIAPVHHLRNEAPHEDGGVQFTGLKRADMVHDKKKLYEIGGVRVGLVNKWNELK